MLTLGARGELMATVRKMLEKREKEFLSVYSALSIKAKRNQPEESCPYRTDIQRDRDRIIHSKAFRRLKHKTQVFVAPTGDHHRTRLTHTLEVAQISRTIGRALRLNEDLIEAIALAHDVGHTPFGHAGEYALRNLVGHYNHNEQSLRVVEYIENNGEGLNLTNFVKNGILGHTGIHTPYTLEGQIVRIGDRIAYLCHDFDDSQRAGLLNKNQLPVKVKGVLGTEPRKMITVMVSDMINTSIGKSVITLSSEVRSAMDLFRAFMFEKIYLSKTLEEERSQAEELIFRLFDYYFKNSKELPLEYQQRIDTWGLQQTVIDYVAGLTDQYAIHLAGKIFGKRAIPDKIGLF